MTEVVSMGEATCLPACDYPFSYGCTDPLANNFDAPATFSFIDDGSCTYDIYGCTDVLATNFDITANVDNGLCIYCVYGCMDSTAANYDALATCDNGSCIAPVYGCTDATANNYNATATVDDGTCILPIYGCTDPVATNYTSLADTDDGSCTYIGGCTNVTATNFDPLATIDDGSCIYPISGCMDSNASNYNPLAVISNGFCIYPPVPCVGTTSIPDVEFETRLEAMGNGNGTIDGTVDNICHVTSLNLSNGDFLFGCTPGQMLTLSGIEDFTDLKFLYAYGHPLTGAVDLTQNLALEKIDFSYTGIISIDISTLSNLEIFLSSGLRTSANGGMYGGCSGPTGTITPASVNTITSITLPTAGVLIRLIISFQPITNSSLINLNLQTSLIDLLLWYSPGLTILDVSANTVLEVLRLDNCSLTSLTLGNDIDLAFLAGTTSSGMKRICTAGNDANLVIHVGNAPGRVALAQSLLTVANGNIDTGTTFAV